MAAKKEVLPDFVLCRNNGFVALMPYTHWTEIGNEKPVANDREAWERFVEEDIVRIFTFCETSRLLTTPMLTGYASGTTDDMEKLTRGKKIISATFYVPFSHGSGNIRKDREFIATPCDLRDVFGETAKTTLL